MNLFYKRLNKLGFRNYYEYLSSHYWIEAKERFYKSKLPQRCLACGKPKFQLHHRSYARLGNELPRDLIPLCGSCHKKVHDYLKTHNTKLSATHKVLRKVFGWTKKETRNRFRCFRFTKKGFTWLKNPNAKDKGIDK